MTEWYLNRFLTSWRTAINERFPRRTKASDGTVGDLRHQAESFSEHNPDRDGSVDAWDMDVNLHGTPNDEGDAAELAEIERLKAEFQRQPGAQLWIHRGQIANKDIDNWRRRPYRGVNAHRKHVHWQSDGDGERRPMTGSLKDVVVDAVNVRRKAPAWPGTVYRRDDSMKPDKNLKAWQARMVARGWKSLGAADGIFGAKTESVVKQFQATCKVTVDGEIGRVTWALPWTRPLG